MPSINGSFLEKGKTWISGLPALIFPDLGIEFFNTHNIGRKRIPTSEVPGGTSPEIQNGHPAGSNSMLYSGSNKKNL
jgi:hypothetical protein